MSDRDTSAEAVETHHLSGLCANLRADYKEWDAPLSLAAAEAIESLAAENAALRAEVERLRAHDTICQSALCVIGAYLLEKGEQFRCGEGAELLDAYVALTAPHQEAARFTDGVSILAGASFPPQKPRRG